MMRTQGLMGTVPQRSRRRPAGLEVLTRCDVAEKRSRAAGMWGGAWYVPATGRPRRQVGLEKQACLSSYGKCAFPVSGSAGQKAASRALNAGVLVRQVMEGRRGQGTPHRPERMEALEPGLMGPRRHVQRSYRETGTRPRADGDREPSPGATVPTGSHGATPPRGWPRATAVRLLEVQSGTEVGGGGPRRHNTNPPPSPACSEGTCRVNPSCQGEVLKLCPASSPALCVFQFRGPVTCCVSSRRGAGSALSPHAAPPCVLIICRRPPYLL